MVAFFFRSPVNNERSAPVWDDFILFVAIGFVAQMVDGAVGMAYGLTSTSVLLSFGIPPAVASASVHAAEVFTTGISGASHWRFGNIDWKLVGRLALPGMIGGGLGAWLLTSVPEEAIAPYVTAYLLAMGLWILFRALRAVEREGGPDLPRGIPVLGGVGGFLDALGGGGWGPIVATTLIGGGTRPRKAVGSTALSEFFVTSTITGAFMLTIGIELWPIIAGLVLGGAMAAPLAAYVISKLPDRALMTIVAVVIILLSVRGLIEVFAG